jgi:hypothetical protein
MGKAVRVSSTRGCNKSYLIQKLGQPRLLLIELSATFPSLCKLHFWCNPGATSIEIIDNRETIDTFNPHT